MRILFLFLLAACSSNTTRISGFEHTIPYHIVANAPEASVRAIADAVFREIDAVYNSWNPHSEISRLNDAPQGVPIQLSPELASLLQRCSAFVAASNGRFDPTIEPVRRLWWQALDAGHMPAQQELEALRPAIGWHNLIFHGNMVIKRHSHTAIDLGAIAKGYAVDLLTTRLVAAGYGDLFVEWGGEVRAHGKHPSGRPWIVGITNPTNPSPDHALAYISLHNDAVATSGDYLQYWTLPSGSYSHVIDPTTLAPLSITADSIMSATVEAADCTTADAMATILLLCPDLETAAQTATRLDLTCWVVTRNGTTFERAQAVPEDAAAP